MPKFHPQVAPSGRIHKKLFLVNFMLEAATKYRESMRQHSWVLNAMFDLATYAERHGLSRLHEQLCHAVAVAATGELADCLTKTQEDQAGTGAEIVSFGAIQQQLT